MSINLKRIIYIFIFIILSSCTEKETFSPDSKTSDSTESKKIIVDFKTNYGQFSVSLNENKAPKTVNNFLNYVESSFYNNTIFHRVINNFMIQGGGFDIEMKKKSTNKPVVNEAHNGLINTTGTIAMARTSNIDSATSQFFINVSDNNFLNHKGPGASFGYAVFGEVIEGYQVIESIKSVETHSLKGHRDVPIEPIIIESVTLR